jgi:two-component system nitrogen regulation sensor histidine kinase NtrY
MSSATQAAAAHSRMVAAAAGWLKRNLAFILMALALAAAVTTYIVMTGSNAPLGIKPRRVLTFLMFDVALLLLLSSFVGYRIHHLWKSLREGSEGSQLQKRILAMFSIVTITPTLIVSVFSIFFFNLGIQTWFNERVQTAVNESLAVAEAYLSEHKENIRGDALAMASDLSRVGRLAITAPAEYNHQVITQSSLRLLTEAMVFHGNRILAQGQLSFALAFERIPAEVIERANKGEVVILTPQYDKVQALVKLEDPADTYLLVGRLVDSKVMDHMENTQGAVNEYNTLKDQLYKLQMTFSAVFVTLALLLLLTSVWYGMIFASRLSRPISSLVRAAERVRGGDFAARVEASAAKDEISKLSRAFNRMTEQLQAQRGELIEANRHIDERRRFSEAVLAGVSAGVIALDPEKRVTLFNRSASTILSTIDQPIVAQAHISDSISGIGELLAHAEAIPGEVAHSTLTLEKNGKTVSLHVRVTVEQLGNEIEGFIVTFDDITLLVAAQRSAAWADVARRVAHEIKNPLTPIQLAAERLKRKYLKFISEDQDTFIKYTDTITRHVSDIGKMVEEFVSFARMPAPKFSDEDIGSIVKKAVFSAQIANPAIDYQMHIQDEPFMVPADDRQLMQVMTNLLKNAAESIEARVAADGGSGARGAIRLKLSANEEGLELTVEDNGMGFPPGEAQKMLEPYVTTRAKGTGLGLAIVRKIMEDHKGRIYLENIPEGGARVRLSFLQQCDISASKDRG